MFNYQALISAAQADGNIVGLFLGGSRGKGFEHADSDYDVRMIVRDGVVDAYRAKYQSNEEADLVVQSLSEFLVYAAWGSATAWDRYDFTHVRADVDKTGEVQKLIDKKGTLPPGQRRAVAAYGLDAYLNSVFRSLKCWQRNNEFSARLGANESLLYVLDALFALSGRPRPFLDYLEKELTKYPLVIAGVSNLQLLVSMREIAMQGSAATQKVLLQEVVRVFRTAGFGEQLDAWRKELQRMLR